MYVVSPQKQIQFTRDVSGVLSSVLKLTNQHDVHMAFKVNTIYGKILERLNVGKWANMNQLKCKILVNDQHEYEANKK